MAWPAHPVIHELNTWAWLHQLSARNGRPVTLGSVPDEVWDGLAALPVDAVWLMGAWERSPEGARIAGMNTQLVAEFEQVLPDFSPEDNIGSAYCIRGYRVDERLGGDAGLAAAREALAERGLKLVLDFVPNHIARDHPWVTEHPEYLLQGNEKDLRRDPAGFFMANGTVIACGKDPYFPPWEDVAQVNAFSAGLRHAAIETLASIAGRCDGVRCDMAILMMSDVFARTWGERAGQAPADEYWPVVIDAVRHRHPHLLFIAEAYWDREWALQQQGFDYCYDKRLYDRLVHDNARSVGAHLQADLAYQEKLVRFIENHDEFRAASTLQPPDREKAAAVTILTLPGAKLLHEGQFEGYRQRLPVFLRRRMPEPVDSDLDAFYLSLLRALRGSDALRGHWSICEVHHYEGSAGLLSWCWQQGGARQLTVVNYGEHPSYGRVFLPWNNIAMETWRLTDPVAGEVYLRDGNEMEEQGLFIALGPWGCHYCDIVPK